MSEPKLTVGRVKTWRPITRDEVFSPFKNQYRSLEDIVKCINERMAELFPPAPQPEAKAEPDYTCPKCGSSDVITCSCSHREVAAAANASIAELVRERDEARAELRDIYEAEPVLTAERHKTWEKAKDDAFRAGVAAAKEACAKRLEREAVNRSDCSCGGCDTVRKWLRQSSHIVRETEVPDA